MKVLEINNGVVTFVFNGQQIKPEALGREHLLEMLNLIYENENKEFISPTEEELDSIRNPVEKEIVSQILKKLSEFNDNVDNIRQEIQSRFPKKD